MAAVRGWAWFPVGQSWSQDSFTRMGLGPGSPWLSRLGEAGNQPCPTGCLQEGPRNLASVFIIVLDRAT